MKAKRRGNRFGALVFFVPIVLIVAVIGYAVISGTASPKGTIVVTAQSSSRYYTPIELNASVTVGTASGVTPFRLLLASGIYKVTYSSLPWFSTPYARDISVIGSQSSYAVGVYDPLVRVVSIDQNHFNTTSVSALHGVTPVAFVNQMSNSVILESDVTGNIPIRPSQNFTYVFQGAGSFDFTLSGTTQLVLTVVVS
jgi:hypothetical protein